MTPSSPLPPALRAKRRLPSRTISAEARAAMLALDRQIAMEDAEDARREHRRLKAGLPEAPRVITVFEGFAEGGATPRERNN